MRFNLTRWLCFGSSLLVVNAALAGPPAPVAPPTDAHPLRFVANQNQWEKPVLFAADVPAGRLFLERNRLLVARYDARVVDELHHHPAPAGTKARIPAHAYAVSFVGGNARPAVEGEQPTGERSNYFLGNDPARWATNVPAFTDVRYRQLYPGTDLRFYSRGPVMEYDFELAAGAEAGRIKLKYDGQQRLRVVDGTLQIETSVGRVTEQQPYAYQMVEGRRVAVPCHYVLGKDNVVSFGLAAYNHKLPLVIDPVLVYSTYSGATAALNWGYTACPDTLGNLYAASVNFTAGYPTTTGAYDASFNGGRTDIVISKYNPSASTGASSLVYATYLGGSDGYDYPHSLVTNDRGELVVLGSTDSDDYPTLNGSYDRSLGGTTDLVVTRLSASGSQLLGSTYVGGTGVDGRMPTTGNVLYANFGDQLRGDITLDRQDNVYFTSVSLSTNYPTTTGAAQTSRSGSQDAVVTKLNANLTSLLWSTYLGGSGLESGYSIQLDAQNSVFVAGGTTSSNFPRTTGGLNATSRGGSADGFVAHLNATGTQVVQSTYLGTSSYDQAFFVQLSAQNEVYVLGQTTGAYPVTSGTYRNANSRQFIHQLNYDLTTTGFSTVVGAGSTGTVPNFSPTAFVVDNCGQLLLSGWGAANIAGLPTTTDALLRTAPNSNSGSPNNNVNNTFGYLYLMQLGPQARRLVYGSYFGTGTTHVDGGTSRFDRKGIIYQAICVRYFDNGNLAPAIITTPNAFARTQTARSSQTTSAAFKMDIVRLNADFTPTANGTPNVRTGCAPLTVLFTRPNATTNGTDWDFGNGRSSTQANNVSTTYTLPGTYTVRLTAYDSTACTPSVSNSITITVLGVLKPSAGLDRTICPGSSTTLAVANASPVQNATYTWSPATGLSSTSGPSVTATPSATTQYIVTATTIGSTCSSTDTIVVSVSTRLDVSVPAPAAFCAGGSTTLTVPDAGTGATYTWSPAAGLSSTSTRSVTASPAATTTYTIQVNTPGGCTGTSTVTVTVQPALPLQATASPAAPLVGQETTFTPTLATSPTAATYAWDFGDGQTSPEASPTHTYTAPGTYRATATATYGPGCTATTTVEVTVVADQPRTIPNIITPNGDGINEYFRPYLGYDRPAAVTLEVYNRWGRKVFEQANYTNTWGPQAAPGVYYYRLFSAGGQTWTGWIEVVK